jgi:carnitine O-acetyltransferase
MSEVLLQERSRAEALELASSDAGGRTWAVETLSTAAGFPPRTEERSARREASRPSQERVDTTTIHVSSPGRVATYSLQRKLPRLPVPTLEETVDKFVLFTQALQSEKDREATRRAADDFLRGDGPKLQEALLQYDRMGAETGRQGSYVEEFWSDSYLVPDDGLVLNVNPYFLLEDPTIRHPGGVPRDGEPIRRAAGLCCASIAFASRVRREALSPDIVKGTGAPLCMDQFKVLFGTSRQPSESRDEVIVHQDGHHGKRTTRALSCRQCAIASTNSVRVVVVLSNNLFYSFPVLWPDTGDVAVCEADVRKILRAIRADSSRVRPDESARTALGALTTASRSQWASARAKLCESSERNRAALRIVDSALFVLALDDYRPESTDDAAANMLCGRSQLDANGAYQVGTCLNR